MEATQSQTRIQELLENAARHLIHKEYREAQDTYDEALATLENQSGNWRPLLLSLRGYSKFLGGSLQDAMADFDQSLTLDPLSASTLLRRGQTYLKLRKFGQACQDFKQAGYLAPDNPQVNQLLEELDTCITEMKESEEKVKYPLKKKVSEIIFNREEDDDDEELLMNFSGVREIDRGSRSSRKSVLFRYGATVSAYESIDSPEDPVTPTNTSPRKEEIAQIEKQEEQELQPLRLHQELSSKQLAEDPFLPVLSNLSSPGSRKSILKNNQLSSSPSMDILKPVLTKRISALSVKDIDGKVVRSSYSHRGSLGDCFSDSKERKIGFGYVIEGKEQLPSALSEPQGVKKPELKRKSSMRTSGSILSKVAERPKFVRKNSSFSNQMKIDGKILRSEVLREQDKNSSGSSKCSSERSLSSSHSEADDKPEPIGTILSYLVVKLAPKLVRKESILKKITQISTGPTLKSKRSVVFCEEPPQDHPN